MKDNQRLIKFKDIKKENKNKKNQIIQQFYFNSFLKDKTKIIDKIIQTKIIYKKSSKI